MGRLALIVAAIAAVLGFGAPRAEAAFPGQNGVIATSDMASEIDLRNTDGTGIRNYCGAGPTGQCGYPAFSADGKSLAADVIGAFPDFDAQLWTGPVSGALSKQLVELPSGTIQPAWSPDGKQIVFGYAASDPTDTASNGLWLIESDGDHLHRLTTTGSLPSWSPLGDRIAYTCGDTHGTSICTIRPDGGGFEQLTNDGTEPDWSPDGSQIAFANGGLFATGDEIEVMDASGSNRHTVIGHVGDLPAPNGYSTQTPRWAPDGTKILFAGGCNYNGSAPTSGCLWTVDPDGNNLTELQGGSAQHVYRGMLAWQPLPLAPSVLGPPLVTGTPAVGQTLRADASASFAGSGLQLKYRWLACPRAVKASQKACKPVPGANGATLVVPFTAQKRRLEVEVTATNAFGSVTARSAPTTPVPKS